MAGDNTKAIIDSNDQFYWYESGIRNRLEYVSCLIWLLSAVRFLSYMKITDIYNKDNIWWLRNDNWVFVLLRHCMRWFCCMCCTRCGCTPLNISGKFLTNELIQGKDTDRREYWLEVGCSYEVIGRHFVVKIPNGIELKIYRQSNCQRQKFHQLPTTEPNFGCTETAITPILRLDLV